MKPGLGLALRILFGVLIVAILFYHGDISELQLRLDARAILGFVVSIALLVLAMLLSALRWHLVLGRAAPSVLSLWRIYLIGWFFSLFLPTSVGGDAVRAIAVGRSSASAGKALSSIVIERLLGVAALAFYLAVGCLLAPTILFDAAEGAAFSLTPLQTVVVMLAGGLTLAAGFLVARRIPRLAAILKDAAELWVEFQRSPGRLGSAFLVSLLVQAAYILVWFELAWSFRLDLPFLTFLVFVPFVSIAAMLPITLSGLGVREGVWALLLAPFGVGVADAVTFSLAYYFAGLLVGAAGGLLFVISGITYKLDAPSHAPRDAEATSRATSPAGV